MQESLKCLSVTPTHAGSDVKSREQSKTIKSSHVRAPYLLSLLVFKVIKSSALLSVCDSQRSCSVSLALIQA